LIEKKKRKKNVNLHMIKVTNKQIHPLQNFTLLPATTQAISKKKNIHLTKLAFCLSYLPKGLTNHYALYFVLWHINPNDHQNS
jgi:hypothetical protein